MNDKNKKRNLKPIFEARELEVLEASMPFSKADLKALLHHLDHLDCHAGDHTLKDTIEFLHSRRLNAENIVHWLKEQGGFCGCEVVVNVESKFEKMLKIPGDVS